MPYYIIIHAYAIYIHGIMPVTRISHSRKDVSLGHFFKYCFPNENPHSTYQYFFYTYIFSEYRLLLHY